MKKVPNLIFSALCALSLSLNAQASDAFKELPSQEEQIEITKNFYKSPTDANYVALRHLSQKNFDIIEQVVQKRWGLDSDQYRNFAHKKEEALKIFDDKKMKGNDLTETYYEFTKALDTTPRKSFSVPEMDKIERFFHVIPVVSPTGLGEIKTILDLMYNGYGYVGIILNETSEFDTHTGGAKAFFEHDLTHLTWVTYTDDQAELKNIWSLLKSFYQEIQSYREKQEETHRKFIDLILFEAIHENFTNRQYIFTVTVPKEENLQEDFFKTFSKKILRNLQTSSSPLSRLSLYIPYVEEHHLLSFENVSSLKPVYLQECISKTIDDLLPLIDQWSLKK